MRNVRWHLLIFLVLLCLCIAVASCNSPKDDGGGGGDSSSSIPADTSSNIYKISDADIALLKSEGILNEETEKSLRSSK